jgi:uncharacterized protein (DUF433 family)
LGRSSVLQSRPGWLYSHLQLVCEPISGKIRLMEPTTTQNHESSETAGTLSVIREHIVSTPDTCGGKPRIAGSRIRVKDVVILHDRQGMAPAEIVSKWPHLTLASIYAALAYYRDHREEINAEIAADQSWYEEQKARSPSLLQEKLRRLEATDATDDTLSS